MKGDFFAINIHQWQKVCRLGMNPACLYLVMAVGSDKSNTVTSWSANALQKYTGVSRSRAKSAKEELIKSGLVQELKTGKHPRFRIVRPDVEIKEQDIIWLPNTIVTGVKSAASPMERLRMTYDVDNLQLFVDLYHKQNLVDDSGISREFICIKYRRARIADSGQYVIWGFTESGYAACISEKLALPYIKANNFDAYFCRIDTLLELGLLQFIPHLCEGSGPEAEIMHSLEEIYTEGKSLGNSARHIAEEMLEDLGYGNTLEFADYLVPALRHLKQVSVVGIGILTYRPKTSLTAAGMANHFDSIKKWGEAYQQINTRPEALLQLLAEIAPR